MWEVETMMPKELSAEELKTYRAWVANWNYLGIRLATGVSIADMWGMLYAEQTGKNRPVIMARLVGKLCTMYKEYLADNITPKE